MIVDAEGVDVEQYVRLGELGRADWNDDLRRGPYIFMTGVNRGKVP